MNNRREGLPAVAAGMMNDDSPLGIDDQLVCHALGSEVVDQLPGGVVTLRRWRDDLHHDDGPVRHDGFRVECRAAMHDSVRLAPMLAVDNNADAVSQHDAWRPGAGNGVAKGAGNGQLRQVVPNATRRRGDDLASGEPESTRLPLIPIEKLGEIRWQLVAQWFRRAIRPTNQPAHTK